MTIYHSGSVSSDLFCTSSDKLRDSIQNSTFTWYLTLKIRNIFFYLRPAGLISKGPWQIPKTQGQASHKYDYYNIFLFIITSIFLCDFVHTGIVIFSDSVEGKINGGIFWEKEFSPAAS